jgi:hypothetical protein
LKTRISGTAGACARSEVTHFYNPTYKYQEVAWRDPIGKCAAKAERVRKFVHKLTRLARFASCSGKGLVLRELERDFGEGIAQFIRLMYEQLEDKVPPPAFVDTFARATRAFHQAGMHTIFVTHSQGNMMLAEAVKLYPTLLFAKKSPRCVADVALASPIPQAKFGLASERMHGFIMRGDILLLFGRVQNDFPRAESYVTDQTAQALGGTLPYDPLLPEHRRWAMELHSVDSNYLQDPKNAPGVRTLLDDLFAKCVGPEPAPR